MRFVHGNVRSASWRILTYVGLPGQKSPKQEGSEVIKLRRLRLAQPLSSAQEDEVVQALRDALIED